MALKQVLSPDHFQLASLPHTRLLIPYSILVFPSHHTQVAATRHIRATTLPHICFPAPANIKATRHMASLSQLAASLLLTRWRLGIQLVRTPLVVVRLPISSLTLPLVEFR